MARLDWEKAASRERVWIAGADHDSEPTQRPSRHVHTWGPWSKAVLVLEWRRECAGCKQAQTRSTAPSRQSSASTPPKGRVARTKGDLVIRHSDGTAKRVAVTDATRAAKEALAAAEERERVRDSLRAPGSVRKSSATKKPSGTGFRKTSGEASIDQVFRTIEDAQWAKSKTAVPKRKPTAQAKGAVPTTKKGVQSKSPSRTTGSNRAGRFSQGVRGDGLGRTSKPPIKGS